MLVPGAATGQCAVLARLVDWRFPEPGGNDVLRPRPGRRGYFLLRPVVNVVELETREIP